ncbi:MAG TPA: hypothetical protein VFY78_01340 [Gammaproteobacteria bacterium]|nr:hypothetical protein [Gammaproteobacteria bacterium]
MDFIKDCFEKQADPIFAKLKTAGFSEEQASQFLTAVNARITQCILDPGAGNLIARLMVDGPSELFYRENIEAIAASTGMDSNKVKTGFNMIMPFLSEAFSQNKDTLVSSIASSVFGSGNAALNSIKKLLG